MDVELINDLIEYAVALDFKSIQDVENYIKTHSDSKVSQMFNRLSLDDYYIFKEKITKITFKDKLLEMMKDKHITCQRLAELLGLKSKQTVRYKIMQDAFKRQELNALKGIFNLDNTEFVRLLELK